MGQNGWAIACIFAVLIIAPTIQRRLPTAPGYGLTIIWALVGICVANGFDTIGFIAIGGIVGMAAILIGQFRRPASS